MKAPPRHSHHRESSKQYDRNYDKELQDIRIIREDQKERLILLKSKPFPS